MHDDDPTLYGSRIAADYDDLYEGLLDTDTAVVCLVDLAAQGPVLEFGVGTGRLALPLANRGLRVHGIETSDAMAEQLRSKPGGGSIGLTIGDFTDVHVDGTFSLVALVFNTIFAVPTQDAQVRCFLNARRHLSRDGRFVVEAWVLDPARFIEGSAVMVRRVRADQVSIDVAQLDPVAQRMQTTQVSFRDGEVRLYPANHRYAWPSELDLMARIAGLELEDRWGSWAREPFTSRSRTHISVYRVA